ncbi:hypothetical protein BH09PSE4_BH09PSE4_02360 [soil metagenome]
MTFRIVAAPIAMMILVGGCAGKGELDESGGVTSVRSACPVVGVPAATGDITLFDPASSQDAAALDVTALMTNVRGSCSDGVAGPDILTTVTFDVQASRLRTDGPRDVTLPYFIAVVRGGTAVTAKRMGAVQVHFDAGQSRASTSGQATATINRAAATLPQEVRERITRKRKAGEEAAAIDPLSDPQVRQAVASATFEALVGFQLTDAQLKYNATRD